MTYDTIVVGLGALGSATLLHLARRGQHVLGIDRYDPPHAWGSTHGDTRITRCAIGEGEHYVPLVLRSNQLWREIEAETGADLLTQCGGLILAPGDSTAVIHGKANFVRRTIAAAERFAIPHKVLTADEAMRRFPQFRLVGNEVVYHEPGAGYVRPERCIEAQLTLARRHGAATRSHTQVASIVRDGGGVCVTSTTGDRFMAAEAVLAAGGWSTGLAGATLGRHMAVTRQVLHWWAPAEPAAFAPDRCPVYIWMHGDRPEDSFYGFPIPLGSEGVKVAMEQYASVIPDPDHMERTVGDDEIDRMHAEHLAARMPGLLPRVLRSAVCPYTMTPDGDFLVSRLPDNDRVLLASACSGHGFKHSAGLGEAIALSMTTESGAGIAEFAASRLAVA